MTKARFKAPLAILLVATALAAILVLLRPEPERGEAVVRSLLVDVVEVALRDQRIDVNAQGLVSPRTRTELVAQVGGKVSSMSSKFEVGGFFRQGDELFAIDDTDYRAAVARAAASVAEAESVLAQEKGRSQVALREWEQRAHRDVTAEAKALALREPQLAQARAQLEATRAELARARKDLQETVVRAPYDGMVGEKLVDVGQFVRVGASMGVIFAVDVAEIRLPVPESKLPYLELPSATGHFSTRNPAVLVDYRYGEDLLQWRGELVRTEGVLDSDSRVLHAVAVVDDPYGLKSPDSANARRPLRMGSFVDAHIEGRIFNDLVKLPREILRPGNKLWVVDAQNTLRERTVKVLRTDGPDMFVYDGLEQRELVCLTSLGPVLPGTPVQIVSSTSQLDAADLGQSREPSTGGEVSGGSVEASPL